MGKSILTEYRLELGVFLTSLFAFLTLIGVLGVLTIETKNGATTFDLPSALEFLAVFIEPIGTWVTWLAGAAPIGLVVCAWWLYDYFKKSRELKKLMDTPSKAKFVRNLDEIEYLAWCLPKRYEVKVIEKKKEFKL
ncbi:MAG: DUF3198 domain-containing protein [Thermoplasmata archaeon]